MTLNLLGSHATKKKGPHLRSLISNNIGKGQWWKRPMCPTSDSRDTMAFYTCYLQGKGHTKIRINKKRNIYSVIIQINPDMALMICPYGRQKGPCMDPYWLTWMPPASAT